MNRYKKHHVKKTHYKMKLKYFASCILLLFAFNILANPKLLSFDAETTMGYSDDIKAQINEVQTNNQISIVTQKVFNRGTYADISMFTQCSIAQIARKHNYLYSTILDRKELTDCANCDWSFEYTVALLESESNLTSEKFKNFYKVNYKYNIIDTNETAKFCGFPTILTGSGEKLIKDDILLKCVYEKLQNTTFDKSIIGMIYEFYILLCCFFTKGIC